MSVKLLTEHHLRSKLKEGYTGSSESTLVKIPHCLKSRHGAFMFFLLQMQKLVAWQPTDGVLQDRFTTSSVLKRASQL